MKLELNSKERGSRVILELVKIIEKEIKKEISCSEMRHEEITPRKFKKQFHNLIKNVKNFKQTNKKKVRNHF